MMTKDQILEAARALARAEGQREQTGLLSVQYPAMTLDDAYAVQAVLVASKMALGQRQIGWKIGLTSRAMQQALGISTPDSGVLLHDMLFADDTTVAAGRFIQPRVEAEIAFVMKADLTGEAVSRADVVAATEYVPPQSGDPRHPYFAR